MDEYREYAEKTFKLHESDDAQAIAFGRDYIKFGQWLNAGGLAALPVAAGILELRGATAQLILMWPAIIFAAGLFSSALSTGFAFAALSARASRNLEASEQGSKMGKLYHSGALPVYQDVEWRREVEAQILQHKREANDQNNSFLRLRLFALVAATTSILCFCGGIAKFTIGTFS